MKRSAVLMAFLSLGLVASLFGTGCSAEAESTDETTQTAADQVTPDVSSSNDVSPESATASCPAKHSWTCCPCGGCGCRPWTMSPRNWCQCF
ncbi:hypothetical protein LVJ94_51375 [Pendulispora rubella]|uniref:Secreted protein n=1 Tax=Pendulispora rubella TaxID=2741070 RepID=A0ABZ2L2X4_9BACT